MDGALRAASGGLLDIDQLVSVVEQRLEIATVKIGIASLKGGVATLKGGVASNKKDISALRGGTNVYNFHLERFRLKSL